MYVCMYVCMYIANVYRIFTNDFHFFTTTPYFIIT
jgi:hypothetical protein